MAEKKNKNSNKRNTGFAFACWLLVALILLVFFFVKKDVIVSNLKNTDFFNRVFGKTPEFVQKHEDKTVPTEDNSDSSVIQIAPSPVKPSDQPAQTAVPSAEQPAAPQGTAPVPQTQTPAAAQSSQPAPVPPATETVQTPSGTGQTGQTKTQKQDTTKAAETPAPASPALPVMNVQLCFVIIDSDGSVSRQIVTRTMSKSDSPLSDAIKALLAGPAPEEKKKNCMTLIPPGTKLLSASVKNGIATLNFSEQFEYNPVGVEGFMGQLMQIVYTATSFSTVNSVQFIIEGQREEYLGSEGEWIGSPLSRSSFR